MDSKYYWYWWMLNIDRKFTLNSIHRSRFLFASKGEKNKVCQFHAIDFGATPLLIQNPSEQYKFVNKANGWHIVCVAFYFQAIQTRYMNIIMIWHLELWLPVFAVHYVSTHMYVLWWCISASIYRESITDVVHGVSVAIKWQINCNLVMFARIVAHQSERVEHERVRESARKPTRMVTTTTTMAAAAEEHGSRHKCTNEFYVRLSHWAAQRNIHTVAQNYPFERSNKMFAHDSSNSSKVKKSIKKYKKENKKEDSTQKIESEQERWGESRGGKHEAADFSTVYKNVWRAQMNRFGYKTTFT